jgi:hypothetical protein
MELRSLTLGWMDRAGSEVMARRFGYKTAWVAARDVSPDALAAAMALHKARPVGWDDAIAQSYNDGMAKHVFITPPISGWTLCAGVALLQMTEGRPPEFVASVQILASTLRTEVQYFATHRVVELHAWARASPSGLARAYMFIGESGDTVIDIGSKSAEETALGFAFADASAPEAQVDGYWEREDLTFPDENAVMQLAGRWSLDPSSFSESADFGTGLLGAYLARPLPSVMPSERPRKAWWRRW